jgi:hypothetical protein
MKLLEIFDRVRNAKPAPTKGEMPWREEGMLNYTITWAFDTDSNKYSVQVKDKMGNVLNDLKVDAEQFVTMVDPHRNPKFKQAKGRLH